MDGLPESEVDVREALGSWGGIPHASRNADWCGTDQPLRVAPILKPPALPGDTYLMLEVAVVVALTVTVVAVERSTDRSVASA
jgi:hypothetical protein